MADIPRSIRVPKQCMPQNMPDWYPSHYFTFLSRWYITINFSLSTLLLCLLFWMHVLPLCICHREVHSHHTLPAYKITRPRRWCRYHSFFQQLSRRHPPRQLLYLLQFSPTSPLAQQLEFRESTSATLMMESLTPSTFREDSHLETSFIPLLTWVICRR